MCGIVGYVGRREALEILIEGLRRQEYRGYDSAGIAVQNGGGLQVVKAPGRIADLEKAVRGHAAPLHGACGLGHTRWATHGGVTHRNAHPHLSCDGRIAVVHNGIIENERQLKLDLSGHAFTSETDTEVIAHLLEEAVKGGIADPLEAVRWATARLRGSFAFVAMFETHPGVLVAARLNCPLLIGLGEGESFLASDVAALLPHTRRIVPVEENEIVRIGRDVIEIFDADLKVRERAPMTVSWTPEQAVRGGYGSFMEKEIHEQPATIGAEIADRVAELDGLGLPRDVRRVVVVGCGTAWHAGLAGKVAIEELARLPVELGYASELRYGDYPFDDGCLTVAISQSGETADTLAASRMAREAGSKVLAITNVRGSTLSREADYVLHMRSGPEIGVAATKTYTSQLVQMIFLAMHLGKSRGTLSADRVRALEDGARRLPEQAAQVLKASAGVAEIATRSSSLGHRFMYIGRRYNLPTAFEGALKMKEISYLHAEGYAAGEMKHGPLALIEPGWMCVAAAPQSRVTDKVVSNIQEIRARGASVFAIATEGDPEIRRVSNDVVEIPACEEIFSPILTVLPLQLLAYHAARALKLDVDRPRNLAKSVTVE